MRAFASYFCPSPRTNCYLFWLRFLGRPLSLFKKEAFPKAREEQKKEIECEQCLQANDMPMYPYMACQCTRPWLDRWAGWFVWAQLALIDGLAGLSGPNSHCSCIQNVPSQSHSQNSRTVRVSISFSHTPCVYARRMQLLCYDVE